MVLLRDFCRSFGKPYSNFLTFISFTSNFFFFRLDHHNRAVCHNNDDDDDLDGEACCRTMAPSNEAVLHSGKESGKL